MIDMTYNYLEIMSCNITPQKKKKEEEYAIKLVCKCHRHWECVMS